MYGTLRLGCKRRVTQRYQEVRQGEMAKFKLWVDCSVDEKVDQVLEDAAYYDEVAEDYRDKAAASRGHAARCRIRATRIKNGEDDGTHEHWRT